MKYSNKSKDMADFVFPLQPPITHTSTRTEVATEVGPGPLGWSILQFWLSRKSCCWIFNWWPFVDLIKSNSFYTFVQAFELIRSTKGHQLNIQKRDLRQKNWKFACGLKNASFIPAARGRRGAAARPPAAASPRLASASASASPRLAMENRVFDE